MGQPTQTTIYVTQNRLTAIRIAQFFSYNVTTRGSRPVNAHIVKSNGEQPQYTITIGAWHQVSQATKESWAAAARGIEWALVHSHDLVPSVDKFNQPIISGE